MQNKNYLFKQDNRRIKGSIRGFEIPVIKKKKRQKNDDIMDIIMDDNISG